MRENLRRELEKWKGLDREGKRSYFTEYYLLPVVAACVVLVTAGVILKGVLFPQPQTELYVAVYDLTLEDEAYAGLVTELAQRFEILPSQILLDDSFRSDSAKDLERLQVLIANRKLDAVVGNDEIIRTLAGYGYFDEAGTVLSGQETGELARSGRLCVTAGYRESEEISFEDHETGQGEEKPYAVIMDSCARWQEMAEAAQEYRDFAFVTGAPHPEHAAELLRLLMGLS